MKTFQNIILIAITTLIFYSCKKNVEGPQTDISASKTAVAVGEEVTFTVTGTADGISIYTGDAGHEYEKSKYYLTNGKDITTESVTLSQTKFDEFKAAAIAHDTIENKIQTMVGKSYNGKSVIEELIREFHSYEITDGALANITKYFTVQGAATPPAGGYATGVGVDPEIDNKVYKYKYSTPGTYKVTLFASAIGRKNYTGSGYKNTRVTYDSEYDRTVVTMEITITVS